MIDFLLITVGSNVLVVALTLLLVIRNKTSQGRSSSDLSNIKQAQAMLIELAQAADRQRRELQIINRLTASAGSADKLSDIIDAVNEHLIEIVDAEVAAYVMYDHTRSKLDYRVYINEPVGQSYLNQVQTDINDFLINHSKGNLRKCVDRQAVGQPQVFGQDLVDNSSKLPKSTFVTPVYVDYEIIGVLYISSLHADRYRQSDENQVLETIASVVSFSIERVRKMGISHLLWPASLVRDLVDAVIMFDLNRQVTMINPAAASIIDDQETVPLETVFSLFKHANLKQMVAKAISTSRPVNISEVALEDAYYEITVMPIFNKKREVVGGAIVFHDIRHMKKIDKMRSDFMSIAAHDLRSPISAIKGFAQMIRHGNYGQPPGGKMGDALQFIEEGADRMISLINDFLTVTRVHQGKFAVEAVPIDINDVLELAAGETELMIKERPVEVSFDVAPDLPLVLVDKNKIAQVLVNLMDNALKHMEQGIIRITAELDQDPRFVKISEHNSGEPISPTEMPHIFDQYFKGSGKDLAPGRGGGLGLGLSIVKIIVEAHGGTISAVNEDSGVTFTFTLPVAEKST